jgi:peptide subunit release factor 1 (eRF1)
VLVAAHGIVHLAVSLPQPPPQEHVLTAQLPRLVPLLDALSLQLPHVIVLADRTGADILAYTAGPDPVETEEVQTDRWPEHKTGRGGWATKRYDATVHNNWHENAKDVAATVDKVAADIGARLVIAAGDERALGLLAEHLPQRVADLLVKVPGGGRHLDGSDEVVAEHITEALAQRVAGDTLALLEKFAEERGQADRATDGVAATLEALRMAQVGTLIFADTRDRERTLFFGPEPVHLALTPEELLDLGVEQPWEALAEEVLARAALGTGAEIRFVGGGMEQSPTDGVGALLRYAD